MKGVGSQVFKEDEAGVSESKLNQSLEQANRGKHIGLTAGQCSIEQHVNDDNSDGRFYPFSANLSTIPPAPNRAERKPAAIVGYKSVPDLTP